MTTPPDGTAGMVMDLQLKYPKRLHLAQRKGKLGPWYRLHSWLSMGP